MQLGLMLGYSTTKAYVPIDLVQLADQLGYHAVWTAEAYGSDCVTPLAWVGSHTQQIHLGTSIMQIPARTPAMTAMTAMTLDQLSGGRMLLGLGMSGPQVVEGWHGQPYGKPLGRTREFVSIVRSIFAREVHVQHQGIHYQIPYQGDDASGLGKPLKSILHGRPDLPIYLAAIGPRNIELTAEIADGWLPVFFSPAHYASVFGPHVETGFGRANVTAKEKKFDIAPTVNVVVDDDLNACYSRLRPVLALYIGGMGAKGKNFYNDLIVRYGFADQATEIQDLYLAGHKAEASAAIPDELIDAIALCGSKDRIKERLQLWESSPVTTMNIAAADRDSVLAMAELVLGVRHDRAILDMADKSRPSKECTTGTMKETSMSSTFAAEAVFERIRQKLAEDPHMGSSLDAVVKFDIIDGPDAASKTWVVDLKDGHNTISNDAEAEADVTITVKDEDMVDLASGALNPQMAFMQGKVKVQGNLMLATKLDKLLG